MQLLECYNCAVKLPFALLEDEKFGCHVFFGGVGLAILILILLFCICKLELSIVNCSGFIGKGYL